MMAAIVKLRVLSVATVCWLASACQESRGQERAAPSISLAPASAPAPAPSASVRAAPPARCPPGMTAIEAFCIDRFEAHLLRPDGSVHPPYERPKSGERYRAASARGVVPQAYISRLEAEAACAAAGKRLCRAKEWYRACSGEPATSYPYGDGFVPGRCNTGKPSLLTKLFGKVPLTYDAHYNNPRLNQEPGFLAKTGEHSQCTDAAQHTYDMVGNLHEWIADDVSARLARDLPLEKGNHWLGQRGMGVFMGGYFSSKNEHGKGCLYVTATHAPDYHDYSTGFRCCATPSGR